MTEKMDLLAWLRKQLAEAEPDLLREMVGEVDDAAIRLRNTSSFNRRWGGAGEQCENHSRRAA